MYFDLRESAAQTKELVLCTFEREKSDLHTGVTAVAMFREIAIMTTLFGDISIVQVNQSYDPDNTNHLSISSCTNSEFLKYVKYVAEAIFSRIQSDVGTDAQCRADRMDEELNRYLEQFNNKDNNNGRFVALRIPEDAKGTSEIQLVYIHGPNISVAYANAQASMAAENNSKIKQVPRKIQTFIGDGQLVVLVPEPSTNAEYLGCEATLTFQQLVVFDFLFDQVCFSPQSALRNPQPAGLVTLPTHDFRNFISTLFFGGDLKVSTDARVILGDPDNEEQLLQALQTLTLPLFADRIPYRHHPHCKLVIDISPRGYEPILVMGTGVRIFARNLVHDLTVRGKELHLKAMRKEVDRIRRNAHYGGLGAPGVPVFHPSMLQKFSDVYGAQTSPETSGIDKTPFQVLTGITLSDTPPEDPEARLRWENLKNLENQVNANHNYGTMGKAPSSGIILSMMSHSFKEDQPWLSNVREEEAALFCLQAFLEDNLAATQIISPATYNRCKNNPEVKVIIKDVDLRMDRFLRPNFDKFSATLPAIAQSFPVEATFGLMVTKIIQYMRGMLSYHQPGQAFLGLNLVGADLTFTNLDYFPEHKGKQVYVSQVVYFIREILYKGLWALYTPQGATLASLTQNAPGCLTASSAAEYVNQMKPLNEYQAAYMLLHLA